MQNESSSILPGACATAALNRRSVDPVEIELKFQVPSGSRERLRAALATATARTVHLRAIYFDTADQRLAAAGFALRLRQEGSGWVQTLKGRGDGLMTRLEHEVQVLARVAQVVQVARAGQPDTPALDAARHAGTPAGDALNKLLADGAALEPRYGTDIQRLQRRVRSGGATIELAFDEGHIAAGKRRLAVCELELELVAGPPAALLALAERWVARHGLWLDVRTKAERGHRLALGLTQVPAVKAGLLALTKASTPDEAFSSMLHSALAQLLPNAAEVATEVASELAPELVPAAAAEAAAGSGGAAALHQLRVAIRRLRTALRVAAPWSTDASAARALEARWREPFTRLGAARDADVIAGWLQPALTAAGAPPMRALAVPHAIASASVVREPAFSLLVLQTMQLALAATSASALAPLPAPVPRALQDAVAALIKRAWRRVRTDAAGFAAATADERHRARKRLKRLRYTTEFLLPILPKREAKRALRAMRDALDALGKYNDLLVAQAALQQRAAQDPHAWFALGWLAAQHDVYVARAGRRLQTLTASPRFWR